MKQPKILPGQVIYFKLLNEAGNPLPDLLSEGTYAIVSRISESYIRISGDNGTGVFECHGKGARIKYSFTCVDDPSDGLEIHHYYVESLLKLKTHDDATISYEKLDYPFVVIY